jgi:hypothetical protein
MTTLSFCGVTIQCYQAGDYAYNIKSAETDLYSGETYANLSPVYSKFPLSFMCHTDLYSEIEAVEALIGTFGTLIIDGISYTDCYIFSFGNIKNLIDGTGKYSYSLTFKKADHH